MKNRDKSSVQNRLFKNIVAISSGLGFAFMLATLASLRPGRAGGIQFVWHWSLILWGGAAFALSWCFWGALWQMPDEPSREQVSQFKLYRSLLIALGVGGFLYPLRFVAADYASDIGKGLATAVLFLGTVGWIVRKIGRGFLDADEAEARKY